MTAAEPVDAIFHALANPTRRAVIERLSQGQAMVSELAEPFEMALPSFMQHLGVLERSGLIETQKRGRIRTVRLAPERLAPAADWLGEQRHLWEQRLDQLDAYVRQMETNDG